MRRHLDGELRQAPLSVLAPDPLDRFGTAGASYQMTPLPDPASPQLTSGQRLDVHTRAGAEGDFRQLVSCWSSRRLAGGVRFYAPEDTVPIEGIVPAQWRSAVVEDRPDGSRGVERIPYELCVLAALREAIRRREVWVVGAVRWRDPDANSVIDAIISGSRIAPASRPRRCSPPRCRAAAHRYCGRS
jgi:hypothetical protein